MSYSLTIQIDKTARDKLNDSDQLVLIVKSFATTIDTAVVWIGFKPLFTDNKIGFADSYGLYATQKAVTLNTKIQMQGKTNQAVSDNTIYNLQDGEFTVNGSGIGSKMFGIRNLESQKITVGLWQDISLNGNPNEKMPINGAELNSQEMVLFQPRDAILIFVGSNIGTSQVVNSSFFFKPVKAMVRYTTVAPYLSVDLSPNIPQTIHYDNKTNQFVPGQLGSGS